HWSRFVVKQTHKNLRPKRSFIRHHAALEELDLEKGHLPNTNEPIHGPRSILHGWEWYEMCLFVHWTPPHSTTILCFDLPKQLQTLVQSALTSNPDMTGCSDPYSVFSVILYNVLCLYDNSVWSIRNHICEWEATRLQEPDYGLLHEIARHAIHVSETLVVASESVKDLQRQQRDFMAKQSLSNGTWSTAHDPFQFPLRILQSLLSRSESNQARLQNEITLVGWWIAPLALELTAAKGMFDGDVQEIIASRYRYFGGKMGKHCVVMAVQPRMGTDAASDLAARMRSAFSNIEYFLVVGIGGGVPGYGAFGAQSQIVMGDVVVSVPAGKYGGVVRCDFGAWTGDGRLEISGHTNGPPDALLAAVNLLRAKHSMRTGTKIPTYLEEMRRKIHGDEQHKFEDQGARKDRLFQDNYPHCDEWQGNDCEHYCDLGRSQLRQNRGIEAIRQIDTPKIHYGTIASSNQLQISAPTRNRYQKELGVICFEMEGAGVIQKHPCLVIRGICDYSDSHKNKTWQAYAAATAAAYAKELLSVIPQSHAGEL
ncbi:purine and uridine phosphorylase, partial [Lepidopterella palustris CBS 459.81]